ncbi:hypothetical protein RM553_06700 [Zunongwangia sp. F363]|uniref:Uncharacterized protein n=1 Tax=Autumnicola tepida TaxID=3075595 RepID=A0ABU3C852_9FLAO|nr:hypothetical protein [Zunongwangia sp. F363]MDT0642519.1 hypothetical protein [Zunongwangia sp. F363]
MNLKIWFKNLWRGSKQDSHQELKDKTYCSKNKFSTNEIAKVNFKRSKEKLFNVNQWSMLPELSAEFQLYNSNGDKTDQLAVHNYININLPIPSPKNWVYITDLRNEEEFAEFTVSPSESPLVKDKLNKEIKHFFIDEATSTFRVSIKGLTIKGYEIGKNEGINNEGVSAGKRKLINTLLANGAWAGFQKLQWQKLTKYLVHKIEIK